ncbi:MAG: pyridoxal phosphate-dependent aminotransferase family protein [Rubricoccaceae bacterium]|nr:pyridoxal phosphate-dependent aminotransferase family protein [Rubricoccaceae bacterium]
MATTTPGSNYSDLPLLDVLLQGRRLGFRERTALFSRFLGGLLRHEPMGGMFFRRILSRVDREVLVQNHDGSTQTMLMFGSNSYLGLPTHPRVIAAVENALAEWGAGVGGPPMLNGYANLHRALEERLADFEGTEDVVLFGSGYAANVGLMSTLPSPDDLVLYDESSHASFFDGLRLGGHSGVAFAHNDVGALAAQLEAVQDRPGDRFVGVEGVYSMDGDLAPLDEIVALCGRHGALLVVDDAHGTGITGQGRGTAYHYGVHGAVDVMMGTFSKAFAVTGGFAACSKPVADYLRLVARSYVFSASLPPQTVAAVLAGLDVIEEEPERHARMLENARYLTAGLRRLGFEANPESAIFSLPVPPPLNIRPMAFAFHQRGLFLNHVEFPAVKPSAQRFRVSVMATHTREDLDRLLTAIEEVWDEALPQGDGLQGAARVELRKDAEG